MARWQITIEGKGLRKSSVEKLVEKMNGEFEGCRIHTTDASIPESRADRFSAAQSLAGDAKMEIESLRDELQEWYDNLPENFQSGDKGSELQSAIDELDNLISPLEDVEGAGVEFPQMY